MEKVNVIIERASDGYYSAYMDNDTFDFGLNAQADTVEGVKAEFDSVFQEMKELYREEGRDFPAIEFEFKYDVQSFLNYYSGILSKSGLEKITGINQKQLWHYSSGKRNPSKSTIEKIEKGLHKLAEDLAHVHLID